MNTIAKTDELNDFAQLLIDNGFTIIAPKEPAPWFHFSIDNKIGYVQQERIGGVTFSSVHKPCKECGTGYRISDDYADLTIQNAQSALCFAPSWAWDKDRKSIVKYKDVADFTKQHFHKEDRIISLTVETI